MTTNSNLSSSPRLPSPPPFTEVQISTAPLNMSGDGSGDKLVLPVSQTTLSTRRIRPGTKSRDITTGPPLTSLSDLDSAFQLQEHLSALLYSTVSPVDTHITNPITRADAARLATPPEGVEESLWCYELTRRLTRDLNVLVVSLLNDHCSAETCPEMRASEWQYLCAVHETPQSCCAIDYSTHTLDQAATMLTSTKFFPSRLSLHAQSTKHLASIFRRLYRIFAHAWFQHRDCFWEVEGELGLYVFFKTVSDKYNLIPEDNLTLPPEAEGLNERHGKIQEHTQNEEEEEEEEEEDFNEWNRGEGPPKGIIGEFGGSDEDDDDDDAYSDESESDEDMIIGLEDHNEDFVRPPPPLKTAQEEVSNLKIGEEIEAVIEEGVVKKEEEETATPIDEEPSEEHQDKTTPLISVSDESVEVSGHGGGLITENDLDAQKITGDQHDQ